MLWIFDHPDYHKWVGVESSPTAFALQVKPYDDVYIGVGTVPPYFHQSLLFKTYKFSGVLYDLRVNGQYALEELMGFDRCLCLE